MTIQYAILGLLSWRPFSGYDLKKVFANSDTLYWSGNNNQVYKVLVELHKEGLVAQEIQFQESLPARKIYTITAQGQEALKQWVLSSPDLPEFRSTFLIQLTWADLLENAALDQLFAAYEEALQLKLSMLREQARREGAAHGARTSREAYLWEKVSQNVTSKYEHELAWAREVRVGLKHL